MKRIFVGIILLILICSSIITAAEFIITQNPSQEISFENDLVAHWEFNENSGNTIYDSSGNGFHGTIYGDPEWTTGSKPDITTIGSSPDRITGENPNCITGSPLYETGINVTHLGCSFFSLHPECI